MEKPKWPRASIKMSREPQSYKPQLQRFNLGVAKA